MCYSKSSFHEMHIKETPVFTGEFPKTKLIFRRNADDSRKTIE